MNKRYLLGIVAALFCLTVSAQDQDGTSESGSEGSYSPGSSPQFYSKNGHAVLPIAKEWSLGFRTSAPMSIINGSVMSGVGGGIGNNDVFSGQGFSTSNPANFSNPFSSIGQSIMGKYMANATTAYRGRLKIGANQITETDPVNMSQTGGNADQGQYVEDEATVSQTDILIGGGLEKRRGEGRVQGIYGGELLLGYSSSSINYSYGNEMNSTFNQPETSDDFDVASAVGVGDSDHHYGNLDPTTGGVSRATEYDLGGRWMAGLRGFVGVEYFFAPKISLGAEFGYTFGASMRTGNHELTREYYDSGDNEVKTTTVVTNGNNNVSYFGAGFDNISSSVMMHFYF